MNVLVACEFSGVVRDAFAERGHYAWSCDLLPTTAPAEYPPVTPGPGVKGLHYQGDIFDALSTGGWFTGIHWDLIIAHPPCTAVCVSGNRHYANTAERERGIKFIESIWNLPVDRLCVENPVGVINTYLPDMPKPQYIQPWQFGHGETKKTGLWKRGLPDLMPTNIVEGRSDRIHKMPPSKDRGKLRSITYQGIAEAMADQWGILEESKQCLHYLN